MNKVDNSFKIIDVPPRHHQKHIHPGHSPRRHKKTRIPSRGICRASAVLEGQLRSEANREKAATAKVVMQLTVDWVPVESDEPSNIGAFRSIDQCPVESNITTWEYSSRGQMRFSLYM